MSQHTGGYIKEPNLLTHWFIATSLKKLMYELEF